MKKLYKISIIISILLIAFIAFRAFSGGKENQMMGKWQVIEVGMDKDNPPQKGNKLAELQNQLITMAFPKGSNIEFLKDNKVIIGINSTKYTLLDKDRIEIGESKSGNAPAVFNIYVNGDKMSLVANGMVINLEKVK